MRTMMWLTPAAGAAALLFALILAFGVKRQDAGNGRMREIAGAIKEGAQAFLKAEYRMLVVFVAVLFLLIGVGIGTGSLRPASWWGRYFPPWRDISACRWPRTPTCVPPTGP